jgi:hypothetical protein
MSALCRVDNKEMAFIGENSWAFSTPLVVGLGSSREVGGLSGHNAGETLQLFADMVEIIINEIEAEGSPLEEVFQGNPERIP